MGNAASAAEKRSALGNPGDEDTTVEPRQSPEASPTTGRLLSSAFGDPEDEARAASPQASVPAGAPDDVAAKAEFAMVVDAPTPQQAAGKVPTLCLEEQVSQTPWAPTLHLEHPAGVGDAAQRTPAPQPQYEAALEEVGMHAAPPSYAPGGEDWYSYCAYWNAYAQESAVKASAGYRKAVPCRHWQRGRCRMGESCNFAHVAALDRQQQLVVPQVLGGRPAEAWEQDSPRARLLTLCGAWGALATRKPLSRSALLRLRHSVPTGAPPLRELQCLKVMDAERLPMVAQVM